ncbi:hypothetical protein MTO96_001187 [Rhipicephalus appendiculatus]
MEPPPKRFRFNIEADIYMLREVREQDPYRNQTLWLSIAENLSLALGRPISARAIRERCDLLLAQFAQEDRANLRNHGYRVRPGAARKAGSASASSSQAPQTADRGERRVATAVRDFASATLQVQPGEDSTGFGDQVEPNLWSTTVFEDVEVVSSAPEGPYEVVGDSSQSSAPRAATPQPQTPPSTAQAAAGGAGQAVGARAAAGRRRTADRHLAFFEQRLALEAETREKAAAQEDRRLDLEERRLTFQERELQQRMREFQDAQEERRQERAMLLQQNQQLANVLQALAHKLKK